MCVPKLAVFPSAVFYLGKTLFFSILVELNCL